MKITYEVEVDVDEQALGAHDSQKTPPPPDPREWYFSDLVTATDLSIATVEHAEMPYTILGADASDL